MIRKLACQRIILISKKPCLLYAPLLSTYACSTRVWYNFSEQKKTRLPRNKQQIWMEQEQKNIKQDAPQDQLEGKTHNQISSTALISFSILTAGLIFFYNYSEKKGEQNLVKLANDISGLVEVKEEQSLVGGDWTLIDSNGQAFSSMNLQGYYYLIFFGYTKSPDVTPSTLYYISSVYRIIRNLPEGAYLKFKIVFVSLDPERDKPKTIKKYLQNFGKQIIGVTGSGPNDIQLLECLKQFRIKFKREPVKQGQPKDRYRIEHTNRVFLMDPDNKYLDHLDPNLSEHQTALAIMTKVTKNQHKKSKSAQKLGL